MTPQNDKLKKVFSRIAVSAIPLLVGPISNDTKKKYGIKCSTGIDNAYRMAFARGEGASNKEDTFDKSVGGGRGGHRCCGSKVGWRHLVKCKNAIRNAPDDFSDLLKEPDYSKLK